MKKFVFAFLAFIFAFTLAGCGSSGDTASSSSDSDNDTSALEAADSSESFKSTLTATPGADPMNLKIGDTVDLDGLLIKLASSTNVDSSTIGLSMYATSTSEEMTLKTSLFTVTSSGGSSSPVRFPETLTVPVNDDEFFTLFFEVSNPAYLVFNDGERHAQWIFSSSDSSSGSVSSTGSSASSSSSDDSSYAWQAAERYGEHEFPAGFKLHWWTGVLAEEKTGDEWFLKAYCDVTNAYGVKEKNLNCEATVVQSGDNYTVTYFVVY